MRSYRVFIQFNTWIANRFSVVGKVNVEMESANVPMDFSVIIAKIGGPRAVIVSVSMEIAPNQSLVFATLGSLETFAK